MRLLALPLLLVPTLAASIKGFIRPNEVLPDVNLRELGSATRVVIDGGRWSARVGKGGAWELQGVDKGTWVLSVLCPGYTFDQLLISLSSPTAAPTIHPYTPFTPLSPPPNITLPHPVTLWAREKRVFVPRDDGFMGQLKGMVGNPMMLMMVGSAAMVFVLPKMMAGMDPEAMKDAAARKERIMAGDLAGGLGGMLNGPPPRVEEDRKAITASGTGGRPKGKKRRQ